MQYEIPMYTKKYEYYATFEGTKYQVKCSIPCMPWFVGKHFRSLSGLNVH